MSQGVAVQFGGCYGVAWYRQFLSSVAAWDKREMCETASSQGVSGWLLQTAASGVVASPKEENDRPDRQPGLADLTE